MTAWMVALVLVAALVPAGLVAEGVAAARTRRRYPPPGVLVDVGGLRLHTRLAGTPSPEVPTVVLESGHGMWSLSWGPVIESIAALAPVLCYDRADYGWSERNGTPRTPSEVVSQLHALLERKPVSPPFVLVGHSLGGLYARLYASRYPEEVAGLVLIDSLHERLREYVSSYDRMQRSSERTFGAIAALSRLGIPRLVAGRGLARTSYILPEDRAVYRAQSVSHAYLRALRDETVEVGRFVRSRPPLGDLGDRPVAVVQAHHPETLPSGSRGYTPAGYQEFLRGWSALQRSLLDLSSRSCFYQSTAGHGEVMSGDSATVVEAVRWVLTSLRENRR